MDYQEARKIASDAATWYFQNGINTIPNFNISKKSAKQPKFKDELWAKLMTEAIKSFHDGLDIQASSDLNRDMFEKAVNVVGSDAFRDIALIVTAAGARRPIEEELQQSFEQMQQPGTGEGQAFTGVEGLSGLISNNADAQAYGQASTIIMQVESAAPNQGTYHQSAQQLQNIAKTQGLSQPFARALSSLGAEYMKMADELTRQSGEGQQQGGGMGTSGLPTGVRIGFRLRAVAARRRIIKEALNG